jgi:hypothetical protein
MTIPAHPDCHLLLRQLCAHSDTRALVDAFPTASDPTYASSVLGLWQVVAEHAPACSVLADCFITVDIGPTGDGPLAIAVSIDHPDRTQPVQLVRYIDAQHLSTDPDAFGPAGAHASLDVLTAAVADLERAVESLTDPDTVLQPTLAPLQPIPTGRPR